MAEQQPGSVIKKNRGESQLAVVRMVKRVSEAAGIGLTLVWQIIKEMEETHAVKSPPRKRNRKILFLMNASFHCICNKRLGCCLVYYVFQKKI
jgi:hypothetical protein